MAYYNQQQPFFSPRVPFTGSIQGGLQEGKVITVTGRVLPGAARFHVNLQCGSRQGADIAIHFNPRYDSHPGYVVVNSHRGHWETEERKHTAPIPRGSNFTLSFQVTREGYMVTVNGKQFMEFRHRISFAAVDTIAIDGGVEVISIAFQNPAVSQGEGHDYLVSICGWLSSCCELLFLSQDFLPIHSHRSRGAHSPAELRFEIPGLVLWLCWEGSTVPATPGFALPIPYKSFISGGMFPGRQITVQGMVNPTAKRFNINLRFPGGIVFHFNPRMDESVVVRNSQLGGRWGTEERSGGMPFYRGQAFMITIMCDPQHYRVMVNGAQMFTYIHRHSALQQIDVLEVDGDISLTYVQV
ncbi:hypothetical protein JZ751_021402 [Albula glossodonta]|uniref:Galectin n=1 Tax=Albula glossodonta TaxID=121402 RepID=A0A8T2NMX4_9TELE|nr:hypothetical protein JZ751_021402 [Albula glossodonta]